MQSKNDSNCGPEAGQRHWAVGLVRSGHVGRASKALTQTGMHDPNDESVRQKLIELHPPCPHPLPEKPESDQIIINATSDVGKRLSASSFASWPMALLAGPLA